MTREEMARILKETGEQVELLRGGYDDAWNDLEDERPDRLDDDSEDEPTGSESDGESELEDEPEAEAGGFDHERDEREQGAEDPLAQLRAENEQLRRNMETYFSGQPRRPEPRPQSPKAEPPAQWPEELKEEYRSLYAEHPEVASLIREKSPFGEALRQRLMSEGLAATLEQALPAFEARTSARIYGSGQRNKEENKSWNSLGDFQRALFNEVSDFREAAYAGRIVDYMDAVYRWIRSKPQAEGQRLMSAFDQGRPHDAIQVLHRYKQERESGQVPPAMARHAAAAALSTVPGTFHPMSPRMQPRKTDYDAGWEEGE